uniref:Uncharacterized protein n=1 Tax=Ananas comosus var. bracteatus TaxID=296719 RepID=A0A6V7NN75_ANACO|nr:unnamed protein product [Ananas comosus var. bracteatus]
MRPTVCISDLICRVHLSSSRLSGSVGSGPSAVRFAIRLMAIALPFPRPRRLPAAGGVGEVGLVDLAAAAAADDLEGGEGGVGVEEGEVLGAADDLRAEDARPRRRPVPPAGHVQRQPEQHRQRQPRRHPATDPAANPTAHFRTRSPSLCPCPCPCVELELDLELELELGLVVVELELELDLVELERGVAFLGTKRRSVVREEAGRAAEPEAETEAARFGFIWRILTLAHAPPLSSPPTPLRPHCDFFFPLSDPPPPPPTTMPISPSLALLTFSLSLLLCLLRRLRRRRLSADIGATEVAAVPQPQSGRSLAALSLAPWPLAERRASLSSAIAPPRLRGPRRLLRAPHLLLPLPYDHRRGLLPPDDDALEMEPGARGRRRGRYGEVEGEVLKARERGEEGLEANGVIRGPGVVGVGIGISVVVVGGGVEEVEEGEAGAVGGEGEEGPGAGRRPRRRRLPGQLAALEPAGGYFVAFAVDGEATFVAGDLRSEAYGRAVARSVRVGRHS